MNAVDVRVASPEEAIPFPRGSRLLPLIPALAALGLRFALFPQGQRPPLWAVLSPGHAASWWDPVSAVLFAIIVFSVSWIARRWVGSWGSIGAGVVLALSWPVLLAVAMPPQAVIWATAVVVGLVWVTGEGRMTIVGWVIWAACAAVLVLPILRDPWLGQSVPAGFFRDSALLHFWRSQIPLLQWPLLLGQAAIFSLGLTGLLFLRGKPAAATFAAFLFAGVMLLWFAPWGGVLFLPVLGGLSVLSGMTFFGLFQVLRGKRWKTTGVLVVLIVVWSAVGSWFSRVSPEDLKRAETDVRVSLARSLLLHHELEAAAEQLNWMHEHRADDRRTRLLDAEKLYAEKRYHEAAVAFKSLRRADPEWKAPLLHSAWANYYDKSYLVAQRTFQRILKDEPDNVSAIIGQGACKIYQPPKDYAEAERLIKKGLSLDENNIDGHWNMVQLLLVQRNPTPKQVEELRYHLRRTMELDKENHEARVYVRRSGWYDLIPPDERSPSDWMKVRGAAKTP